LGAYRREKEQEFLDLRQGDLIVLEYERRFQDLPSYRALKGGEVL
jgi:hypothetical protein